MSSGSKKPVKKVLTEEERVEMCRKMDEDLDIFIEEMKAKHKEKMKNQPPKEEKSIDQIIEELERHPAFAEEIDLSKPLTTEVEGLMALKYECDDPTARADNYREDGNDNFKKKLYRIAIANYTEGITSNSPDRQLNAVLYTNRAAAQFRLGNYRSAFNDCIFARKYKVDHMKAILKGINCCLEMKKYDHCIKWCDAALLMDPDDKDVLDTRSKAERLKKLKELENRKQAVKERKEEAEEKKLIELIQKKGVKIAGLDKLKKETKLSPLVLANIESHHPAGAKVKVDEENNLLWPVLFFYPEYSQTDFIEAFNETNTFADHILHMFGEEVQPPSWDTDNKYKPESIQIFFENREEEKIYPVDINSTLAKTMLHKK
ncbi:hypothetical protein SNE40_012209 [Patella caerulea]|uniref:Cns1/TTC4 wheel domain-containing protein n=2 Tax=Patella caerulea TaxID=87958 RepID=A0AAN8JLA8_PATCE